MLCSFKLLRNSLKNQTLVEQVKTQSMKLIEVSIDVFVDIKGGNTILIDLRTKLVTPLDKLLQQNLDSLQIFAIKDLILQIYTRPLIPLGKNLYKLLKMERTIKLFMDVPSIVLSAGSLNEDHNSILEYADHSTKFQLIEALNSRVNDFSNKNVRQIFSVSL